MRRKRQPGKWLANMSNAERVIQIALAEVGYREKASNASLDDPLANAGSGN